MQVKFFFLFWVGMETVVELWYCVLWVRKMKANTRRRRDVGWCIFVVECRLGTFG